MQAETDSLSLPGAYAGRSEKRFLLGTSASAVLVAVISATAIYYVGFAFLEPCTSPQGKAIGYTGCFGWSTWLLSLLAILAAFACAALVETAALSAIRQSRVPSGLASAFVALAVLLALTVMTALLALILLAKPWATYQTYANGNTKPEAEWTIDVWLVFLGYYILCVASPFAVALGMVCKNQSKTPCAHKSAPCAVSSSSGSSDSSDGSAEEAGMNKSDATAILFVGSAFSVKTLRRYWMAASFCFLATCFFVTTFGTPMWNFSMNSYFKSVSKHAVAFLPVGELPCSLTVEGEGSCVGNGLCKPIVHWITDFSAGVDPCPWFSFKIFPDTILYYSFLTAFVMFGAMAHSTQCKWARRVLNPFQNWPTWLNPFPNGLSVLEAIAVACTTCLFIAWFSYWHWGYGRFQEADVAHDCWTSEAKTPSDAIGRKGTPGIAVSTAGSQLTCDEIPGSVPTGHGELHILCRVTGHMASLAFALTMIPTAKNSVLMRAVGLSYEKVMHWHRGLGAVSYLAVTLHMLLWWSKWILEGTFVRNLLIIDTQKWLWVTPSWNHYENWSVLMAQIAWFFFTAVIIIAWTVRRRMYRLFYVSHQLALVFLFFGVMHAWSFWFFVIPGLGLWWLDRLDRLVKASEPTFVTAFAAVPGTDVTHVELQAPGVAARFVAGQFALLNIPDAGRNEWHPFTINVRGDKVHFLCKSEGGWTRRLRDFASTMPKLPVALCVGPYGGINMMDYSHGPVFLAAGGIGVTPVISIFNDILHRRIKGVTLLWVVRSADYLQLPFVKEVLEDAAGEDSVKVIVHITQAKGQEEVPASHCENIVYERGRPDVEALLREATAAYESAEDGFAFACGPAPLTEEVLRVSRDLGMKQHSEVFLF